MYRLGDLGHVHLDSNPLVSEPAFLPGPSTVTIEQCALFKQCLRTTKMVTHNKIVDPLYILHENMQF
jgi:hypothetical protein